ncbi:MAG TPA: STAS domain-containing protein [Rhodanobacteraceae bacterium]|nr:STAS domain-containing protein [Rhodanobacteraceae bacterium]
MSLSFECDNDHDCVTLHIADRFDFSVHRSFHQACLARPRARSYVVDLGSVTSMDSSALGMLLLLCEHAGGDDADIRIVNADAELTNTFRVAGLDRFC